MKISYTAIRPFMRSNNAEPNEHYRPWLEKHIGVQGIAWNWRLDDNNIDNLAIDFSNIEQATFFGPTWQ